MTTSFIDRESRENLAVHTSSSILRSPDIPKRGKKQLACAVITAWFENEKLTADVMQYMFRIRGIDLGYQTSITRPGSSQKPSEEIDDLNSRHTRVVPNFDTLLKTASLPQTLNLRSPHPRSVSEVTPHTVKESYRIPTSSNEQLNEVK